MSHTQLARDSLSADIGRAQVWRLSPAGRQKYSSALPWCKEQKKNTVRKYGNELVMVIHPSRSSNLQDFLIQINSNMANLRIYSLRQWPPSLQRSADHNSFLEPWAGRLRKGELALRPHRINVATLNACAHRVSVNWIREEFKNPVKSLERIEHQHF